MIDRDQRPVVQIHAAIEWVGESVFWSADILGVPVIRPKVVETTALGAAYAAGIAVGFWSGEQDVVDNWAEDKRWLPSMEPAEVDRQYRLWKKAVSRTLEWVDEDVPTA